ncbi:hypothetical protein Tsubulata_012843 [Turnera subulata]|uniref:ZZ-type domain-containing protein n=1 Tax=Turnera subulata TaxID=218843 RepID=A0A9Q0JB31_9ROSI|nr:hypothetical protein Tsubulata_012843 [Turnera subulata]
MWSSPFRRFSTSLASSPVNPTPAITTPSGDLRRRNWNPIPIPHRTIPEPRGQDLDFVNVAHSHLIHSDWDKLNPLSTHLTPFRVKHVLLKIQKDHVLSLEFFNWVETQNPNSHTLETHSIILHILTKNRKFKPAESVLRCVLVSRSIELPDRLFEALLYSYRMCDSSARVFDSLFRTYAHMKKFRNASDAFVRMKEYGFLPTVESCNAYLSSLLDLHRVDIAFVFYRQMRQCRITPNVYTLNMVMCALCKSGRVEKALEVFREMESLGISPNVVSYNTLILGHCNNGLSSLSVKLKDSMVQKGVRPNVVTFNTLICGFCKEGKLQEANRVLSEMKALDVAPNTVTYNTLINGYSQLGNTEKGSRFYEEMRINGVKADILTYNALMLGLCKEGKTKKAAYLVKELEKEKLVPNASTFSALISGQCVRKNSDRAFQLYKIMTRNGCHPTEQTFKMLMSTFCQNEDFEGAFLVLMEMLGSFVTPSSDMCLEVYTGLGRNGHKTLAAKLCREMESRNIVPEASQDTALGKAALYHYNYCSKDISGMIRIKCAVSPDFDLCIECFSVGAEVAPHKCNHPYWVMDNLSFPLICPDWNADEEALLLEGIDMSGFGNWTEVSEHDLSHVMGKSREELLAIAKGRRESKKDCPTTTELLLKDESSLSARIKCGCEGLQPEPALMLGLCKEGKTKKVAYFVKELEKEKFVPNASSFSALTRNGCHPTKQTFKMLMSTFCRNENFEGAFLVLMEMLGSFVTPGSDMFLEVYTGLGWNGRKTLAVKLCREMESRNIVPEGFNEGNLSLS